MASSKCNQTFFSSRFKFFYESLLASSILSWLYIEQIRINRWSLRHQLLRWYCKLVRVSTSSSGELEVADSATRLEIIITIFNHLFEFFYSNCAVFNFMIRSTLIHSWNDPNSAIIRLINVTIASVRVLLATASFILFNDGYSSQIPSDTFFSEDYCSSFLLLNHLVAQPVATPIVIVAF